MANSQWRVVEKSIALLKKTVITAYARFEFERLFMRKTQMHR